MKDPITGDPHTAHTTNLVPFILVNDKVVTISLEYNKKISLRDGALCDVAQTILALMGLEQPTAMTGKNLIYISDI